MAKRFEFVDAKGERHTWSRGELADTILEGEAWDKPEIRERIDKLESGKSIKVAGETLTRVDGKRSSNPKKKRTSTTTTTTSTTTKKTTRKSNPGKKLKRAPVPVAELEHTSDHGHVLALTVDDGEHRRFRFKQPRPVMQWCQQRKALVWVTGVRTPRRSPIGEVDAKSRAAFERFHGRGIDGVRVMRRPKLEGDWRRVGRVVQIEYSNPEKWGRDGAEHDFTSSVSAYRFGGARGPAMWVLAGGSLRMTSGGIEG